MRNLLLGFLLGTALSTYAWDSPRSPGGDFLEQNRLDWRYGPVDSDASKYDEYESKRSPCRD